MGTLSANCYIQCIIPGNYDIWKFLWHWHLGDKNTIFTISKKIDKLTGNKINESFQRQEFVVGLIMHLLVGYHLGTTSDNSMTKSLGSTESTKNTLKTKEYKPHDSF